jgi:putative effector of murein hydrolase
MMVMAAYLTRGLQMAIGSSKRSAASRAEELGEESDEIPLAAPSISESETRSEMPSASVSESPSSVALNELPAPPRSQPAPLRPPQPQRVWRRPDNNDTTQQQRVAMSDAASTYVQVPLPPPRARLWSVLIVRHLDVAAYGFLLVLVGLPVYHCANYAMPLQLSLAVLTYFAALEIPPTWRQYLHPVLVSSLATVLAIWTFAAIKGDSLRTALGEYKTGAGYLQLWESASGIGSKTRGKLPGAGDVFGTVLDASIVSLALPMYQYRRELREHFVAIVVPNILISIGSLFSYPYVCYAIGIGARRSLAFAARSLTLALAMPATQNLGGDVNTVAALAIMSGILGVLIGQKMLAWMRIPEGRPAIVPRPRGFHIDFALQAQRRMR